MSIGPEVRSTEAYLDEDSTAATLRTRALRALPGGSSRSTLFRPPYPPYARAGDGCWLIDEDGERRLDLLCNYTALVHGHRHTGTVNALFRQLDRGTCFAFPTGLEVELAEEILARLPTAESVTFTNSGTEAVMVAVRLARAFTGRTLIARFKGCYHGAYDDVELGRGVDAARAQNLIELEFNEPAPAVAAIEAHAGELAAVIIDLAPNRIGLTVASVDFVRAVAVACRRSRALLIADEIVTFRAGHAGMQGVLNLQPDLTALGKMIGGGLPVGAVVGSQRLMAQLDPRRPDRIPRGGTFNANPMSMAAGLAALRSWTPEVIRRTNRRTETVTELLQAEVRAVGLPCSVSRAGSLFQVRIADSPVDPGSVGLVSRFAALLLRRGAVLAPNGLGCVASCFGLDELSALEATVQLAARELASELAA